MDAKEQKQSNVLKRKTRHIRNCFVSLKKPKHIVEIIVICGAVTYSLYLIITLLTEQYNFLGTFDSDSKLGVYQNAAVSTDASPCAELGKNLLTIGGSAVDAAVGVMLCKGLAIPNSSGLGGGGFILVYNSTDKKSLVYDGREQAPDYSTEDMFGTNQTLAARGPLSIAVPGELAAMWAAHQKYGKLTWAQVLQPVIVMAEKGVPLVEHMNRALTAKHHSKHITPLLKPFFTDNKTGEFYKLGDIVKYPVLAETLKKIQLNGADEFYRGQTGKMYVEDLQAQGGKLTFENLNNYRLNVLDAMEIPLTQNLRLYTPPLPTSGIILSVIMRIMIELGYNNREVRKPEENFKDSVLFYHHFLESVKFAYAQRALLEDMPDEPGRVEKLVNLLKSESYINNVVSKMDHSSTHLPEYYDLMETFAQDDGTAHVSVVDSSGLVVSATTSVNLYFGSGLVSPRTGILYNDVMDDFVSPYFSNAFSLSPSKYNRIRPGRRPMSSMSPSVFIDPSKSGDTKGHIKLVIGGAGGSMITTSVALVATRNLLFNEDLKTAIDAPRVHHQLLPNKIWYEHNFSSQILNSLHRDYNHQLKKIEGRSSVIIAISSDKLSDDTEVWTANSDYRKAGESDGL